MGKWGVNAGVTPVRPLPRSLAFIPGLSASLAGDYRSTLEKSSINPSRIRGLESSPRFQS